MKKSVVIGLLSVATSFNSFAHDAERLNSLEKEVQELKLRLSNLETPTGRSVDSKKNTVSSDGWKFQINWRSLVTGMSPNEVRALLGEPQQIRGGNVAVWTYQNKGDVTFLGDTLYSWREPKW